MTDQLSFFEFQKVQPLGEILRDRGIERSLKHAKKVRSDWQEKALSFLYCYAKNHDRFSGEMVRESASGSVPEPPSLRAWGAIILFGAKNGWIEQDGYTKVNNPKAHKANAAMWRSLL